MRFVRILVYIVVVIGAGAFFYNRYEEKQHDRLHEEEFEHEMDYSHYEDQSLAYFSSIRLSGNYEVEVKIGNKPHIHIEAIDSDARDDIKAFVKDRTLYVQPRDKRFKWKEKYKLEITAPVLSKLHVSGSSEVDIVDQITGNQFDLNVSGKGDVDMDLDVKTFQANLSGKADIDVGGQASYSEITVSGAGDIHAFDLRTKKTRVNISGKGNAEIYTLEELDAKLSGAGTILYRGNPSRINKHKSGIGTIRPAVEE
ncbi:MAG: head GIN domain-containing protein [Bacteroidota bacterium]